MPDYMFHPPVPRGSCETPESTQFLARLHGRLFDFGGLRTVFAVMATDGYPGECGYLEKNGEFFGAAHARFQTANAVIDPVTRGPITAGCGVYVIPIPLTYLHREHE